MKKFVKNFRAAFKDPSKEAGKPLREDKDVLDPKFIVVNPPNPSPAPPPPPPPLPDNKGLLHQNHSVNQGNNDDIGTFGGFGSWMASFEPDPNARGVVEVAAPPVHGQYQQEVSEVLSLEEGKFSIHICCPRHASQFSEALHFIQGQILIPSSD